MYWYELWYKWIIFVKPTANQISEVTHPSNQITFCTSHPSRASNQPLSARLSSACSNSSWSFWWFILTFIICTAAVLFYNLLTLESNHNVRNYCNVLKCKVLKFLGVIQCKKIGSLLMLWNVFPDFHAVEALNPIRSPHDLYTWILITIRKSKKLRCHSKYEDCGVTVCQLRQKNRNNVLDKSFRSDQDELLHQWVMCYHQYFIAVNIFRCLIRFGSNFWCNSLAGADQSVHYKE